MFARRIRYAGYDNKTKSGFIALIELVRKKGGNPTWFLLYSYTCTAATPTQASAVTKKMKCLPVKTAEEAIRRFWFQDDKDNVKKFPNHDSKLWEKTTFWLHAVAINSWRVSSSCSWMRVGTPAMWWKKRRERKQRLKIGNIFHILAQQMQLLRELERKRRELVPELGLYKNWEYGNVTYHSAKHRELSERIEALDMEIYAMLAAIEGTREEMRCRTYQMFPGRFAGEIPPEFSLVG